MAEREAAEPEDRRIRYRIGINIGDVQLANYPGMKGLEQCDQQRPSG